MSRLLRAITDLPKLEGSTRPLAVMRVGLVMLIWSRLAFAVRPIRDLGNPEQLALSVGYFTFTGMMLIGWRTRLAAAGNALVMLSIYYWFGHHRGMEPWTHHHVYVLVIFSVLMALTPCGGSYSVDRFLTVRAAERQGEAPPPERGLLWGQNLIRLQVTSLYFWTAFDKTTPEFLSGERMEAIFHTLYLGSDPILSWWWTPFILATSIGTVALEYALAFAPWHPRLRAPVLLAGVALHASIYYLLPVSTFSASMFLLYVAWFDPDAVHRLIDHIQDKRPGTPPEKR